MINSLIKLRTKLIIGKISMFLLKMKGIEIPSSVVIGKNVHFVHGGNGVVIHPRTVIKDNVTIFHQVTIGNANVYDKKMVMKKIIIEDGAILCAGSKILCKEGTLIVGKNALIGANAVLLKSTGENEIWAGMPAKKVGTRKSETA